jgi:hypothetical protein
VVVTINIQLMKLTSLVKTVLVGASLAGSSLFANSIQVWGNSDGTISAVTSDNGSFLTFCLEKETEIHAGFSYPYTIGTAAVYGGPNSNGAEIGFDTISQGTAGLYLAFLNGTLTDGHLLQSAIWALEDEISLADLGANAYYEWAIQNSGGKANYTGTEVKVINPWEWVGESKNDVQSVLFRVPDGSTTALLLGLGLVSLGMARRRK